MITYLLSVVLASLAVRHVVGCPAPFRAFNRFCVLKMYVPTTWDTGSAKCLELLGQIGSEYTAGQLSGTDYQRAGTGITAQNMPGCFQNAAETQPEINSVYLSAFSFLSSQYLHQVSCCVCCSCECLMLIPCQGASFASTKVVGSSRATIQLFMAAQSTAKLSMIPRIIHFFALSLMLARKCFKGKV